jgi:hypothetical protein
MVARQLGSALKTRGLYRGPLTGRPPPSTQKVARTVVPLHPLLLRRLLRFPLDPLLPDWDGSDNRNEVAQLATHEMTKDIKKIDEVVKHAGLLLSVVRVRLK